MKEIYVIYNKDTGFIEGAGRINREWDITNADGSTVSEYIVNKLIKSPEGDVAYFPNQLLLPKKEEYKIDKSKLVNLTAEEVVVVMQPEVDQEKIEAEIEAIARATAIQNLKDRAELPVDYMDTKI